jgi:hypothetical protein
VGLTSIEHLEDALAAYRGGSPSTGSILAPRRKLELLPVESVSSEYRRFETL